MARLARFARSRAAAPRPPAPFGLWRGSLRSLRYDRFSGLAQPKLAKRAKAGGHDRDRTCDPYHVKVVLSLVSPSARPKNRRRSAAYAAYDFVVSYAIDPKMKLRG